jgi:ketosteroid isomerase-like protein
MSGANVEVVERAYREFGETGRAVLEVLDPGIEWHTRADLPDSGVYRGHEAVAQLIQSWVDAFDGFRAEIHEILDRDPYVVVSLALRGRVAGTASEVAMPETHVWKLRDGMVVEMREYNTLELALEAVEAAGA